MKTYTDELYRYTHDEMSACRRRIAAIEVVFEQGYDIDRAYAEADRHAAGSDAWHYWMDEAKRLEKLHRKGAETELCPAWFD